VVAAIAHLNLRPNGALEMQQSLPILLLQGGAIRQIYKRFHGTQNARLVVWSVVHIIWHKVSHVNIVVWPTRIVLLLPDWWKPSHVHGV